MKSFDGWSKQAAAVLVLISASTAVLAFPEIPFCPLGGPPGWWNRVVDDDDHYYPPPYYYPPPVSAPYRGRAWPHGYAPNTRVPPPPNRQ